MTSSSWQQTESDNSTMRLHLSLPPGAGPFPAMVVIQHQGGVDEFIQNPKMTVKRMLPLVQSTSAYLDVTVPTRPIAGGNPQVAG